MVAAFALVWAMARPLVGAVGALVAILIIDGLHYFSFTAPKFNHDVIQLPFWALAGFAYWAALRRGRMVHWVLLGLGIGIAVWAKYFVVVLALPLALFLLFDRDARRTLATPGPWIAVAVALVVMAPHLVWLVQNDFLPFAYAEARARALPRARSTTSIKPPQVPAVAVGLSGAVVADRGALSARATRGAAAMRPRRAADAFDRRIVTLLAFGPALTVVLLSLVSGRDTVAMWGYPLWLFLGLWIVLARAAARARHADAHRVPVGRGLRLLRRGVRRSTTRVLPRYDQERYIATLFPGDQLGQEMSRRYRAMTGQPLAYVIGRMWDGGNVSHYAPERPRVLIDGDPRRAPWIDLGDLRARGAVVVWTDGGDPRVLPRAYRAIADDAEVQPPFTLPFRLGTRLGDGRLGGAAAAAGGGCGRRRHRRSCVRGSCSAGRAVGRDLAVSQMNPAVHALGQAEIVGDGDHGLAAIDDLAQHLEHLLAGLGVERAGRLVGQDDVRVVGERAGDGDALALAAGKLVRPLVHVIGKPERRQQVARALAHRTAATARRARASAARRCRGW